MNPHYEIIVTHRSDGSATVHLHYNGYPCRQQRDCADDAATTACVAEYVHLWRDADVRHVGADGKAWTFGQEAAAFSVGQRVAVTRDVSYGELFGHSNPVLYARAGEEGEVVGVSDVPDKVTVYFSRAHGSSQVQISVSTLRALPQPGDGLPAQTLREGGEVLANDEDMTYAADDMPMVWRRDYETLRDAALDVLTGMTARTVDKLWQLVTEE